MIIGMNDDESDRKSGLLDEIRTSMRNPALLDLALTHASHANVRNPADSYERLEFLGDAVLGLVIVDHIYRAFPRAAEGPLARLKSALVSTESLSAIATELSLFEVAQLGEMPQHQLEMARKSVGADLVESIIGAVYVDQGFEAANALILRIFGARLREATLGSEGARDAKTALHEQVQGALRERPSYHVMREEGPAHARRFYVEVRIQDVPGGAAWGTSHKSAERAAAEEALEAIAKGEIVLEKRTPQKQY